MARPTKAVDELVTKRIVDAVRKGASRTGAAEAARVGRSTFTGWLKRGADGEEPYASLLEKVREAEGELEGELVAIVKGHAVNTWGAACWLLERKFGRRWALKRDRAPEDVTPLSEAELRELVAEGAKTLAEMDAADSGKKNS